MPELALPFVSRRRVMVAPCWLKDTVLVVVEVMLASVLVVSNTAFYLRIPQDGDRCVRAGHNFMLELNATIVLHLAREGEGI